MGRHDGARAPRPAAPETDRHLVAPALETARTEYERGAGLLPVAMDDDATYEEYAAVG